MRTKSLENLIIRNAVVQRPGLGYIIACDLTMEEKGEPHAFIFTWEDGTFEREECNYEAHSICIIEYPTFGIVDISEPGYYTNNTEDGMFYGDIIEDSYPQPKLRRIRGFRSVSRIADKAYAVGLGGMVYRLDKVDQWTRIDDGLPQSFDIEAIHGLDDREIYAVGSHGQIWSYDNKKWLEYQLPTSANLNTVKCTNNGEVYIAGMGGILMRGRRDKWEVIEHEGTEEDIWDLEWFNQELYLSTMDTVYQLTNNKLKEVDFSVDRPQSCNQLSAANGVLWSIGEYDIMSFDGKVWTRIV